MADLRLDAALADRGLVRSRSHANTLISAGDVTVDGVVVTKASLKVSPSQQLEVNTLDRFVSRAAHKLVGALDAFTDVAVAGRLAMDVGASTGGFSQVLLERGARKVLAIEVGHDQLAPELYDVDELVLVEGFNARYMTAETLAEATGVAESPDLVVADLSFISLTTVLPALRQSSAPDADFVLLIKPQFEVGRGGVKAGVVTRPEERANAIRLVLDAAWELGLGAAGLINSPIVGSAGNHEYVVWLSATHGKNPTEWIQTTATLTQTGA
ncbi:TlyA family RNA methyltransferase [Lysinibacter cavernae]|uniref:23S rRNA (Cytidine1920-2'-O)/16S rRNA (Cytidine1409-2'-O)-methyltransferase n=1 Tax=Lysinibacter cavernae TaxID=1640652 RepID=A0A7X5R0X6_9MICO|nr:TlyA family RNA methyltransferase [Lysinibacter cavernae]NIH53360.1 23S rRNA (cytidine1920-2'-O)/16S rRNA (cytidine1409-2'-O)-methyltransferase [Lysinibacter cavernae]